MHFFVFVVSSAKHIEIVGFVLIYEIIVHVILRIYRAAFCKLLAIQFSIWVNLGGILILRMPFM